ncbi:MAG: hypothetical protein AVO35_02875 [Candidatus Aegiribacteria sp. MLS_C]|nr:MAG: hypothetical protein AVO35_02875 [Candidatus Aegiribacteria sp. MLS_C]
MNPAGQGLIPGKLLLMGTRSPAAEEGLARRTGLSTAAGTGGMSSYGERLMLLCPGDREELSRLLEEVPERPEAGGTMIAVLTGAGVEAMPEGRYVLLEENGFTFRLLAELGYGLAAAMKPEGLKRTPIWQVTGALLPFFVHNMNNILARIMGNAELARMYCGRPEEAAGKLDSALAGVEEMRKFVRNLAALSVRPEAGSTRTSALLTELEQLTRMFSGRSVDITFRTTVDSDNEMSVQVSHLRLAACLVSASAAVMVNGSGSIRVEAEESPEGLRVVTGWTAGTGSSGLLEDGEGAAVELMAACAAVCGVCGLGMRVEQWGTISGEASVRTFSNLEGGPRGR